ncbi:uncharacterized protein LOC133906989 isoform X2 [Phragmites australis]|uniref:uncharacterized protein LOC133906989 isoform X2 n=1 Tax=Phragmites australis TaxID=29695 RepID=UPI002D79C7AB|nr:uncharacterized protein LOC133906989 isoform X2 [Phragmites australis]
MVPNGLLPNVAAGVTRRLDAERWAVAEERTAELIARIQPTPASEERRRTVADYVQRLIMGCLSCQVFTFGSVPLKTYLPDGDIDVTAFSNCDGLKDTWAITVRDTLEHEEKSENAEFRVREVQYIQAEVKIIKCLVENIVVDISFNQVGGLCTLCFLEEMDNLISQNHLFKRSIILIKAWCYYESRILGAHHGLISTYALETLVLYIFHVFNSSFAGPLEVLYQFLEFFSNFDWEKFCVSLLGPVPISSLPDMSVQPPRKDGGTLLLSKSLLDICSSKYAVMPSPHENQVQPFVSKHFNVVDPLRTSNNLGRSVSKGNFFRIRNAFAFGAKRLARLLECPREDLAVEVKQFFTNTWRRHGSGNRPDAPAQSPINQTVKVVPIEAPSSHRSTTTHKKKLENPTTCMDHDSLTEDSQNHHDPTTQLLKKGSVQYRNSPITVHSAAYPTQSQKICAVQSNTKVFGQLEKNSIPGESLLGERNQRVSKIHSGMNDRNGQSRLQFARTNSSPELTDSSVQGFPCSRCTRVAEVEKTSIAEYSSRRNSIILGVSGNHGNKFSQEKQVSSMNDSFDPSILVSDPSSVSSSNHEDICLAANEELASVSEAPDMLHKRSPEEHDPADLVDGFDRQVPLPVQIPSHLSVAPPPLMVSSGYPQRDLAGVLPPNFSFIGTPWLRNMQFVHGFVAPSMNHHVGSPTFAANSKDGNESERSATTGTNCDDGGNWHENSTGFSGNFNQEQVEPEMFNFKELSFSLHDIPCAPSQGQLKSSIEDSSETLRRKFSDLFHQVNGGINFGASNMRLVSSQASCGQTILNSSCGESTGMFLTSSQDTWAKIPAAVAPSSSLHSKTKTSWQFENTTEGIPSGLDGTKNSNAIPGVNSDFSGGIAGPISSEQSTSSQVTDDHVPLQVNMCNSVFTPFLIGPQQRQVDNSGLTFVPTGPPVPFVVYPFFPGRTDSSVSQFERYEGRDQFPLHMAFQNSSSHHDANQPDANIITPSGSVVADHDHKSDILNSDLSSHWKNLQYGRFCQNARPPAPVLYPFAMPPMYLPGHFPLDGPGRQPAHTFNLGQVRSPGQGVAPVIPLQLASERDSGVFQRYGEDAPRYRGGTGTYLPTPKVPFRDRQSGSRNYRGSYKSDRIDQNDKEGSWANSKQRNVGRNYGRSQSEKSGVRPDRQTSDVSQADRHWQHYKNDSYRREASGPSSVQNHSFGSTNSTHNAVNMACGVPSQSYTVSSGTSASSGSSMQPVVMVYSCDQSVNYGATSKPIEFGSFGAIPSDIKRSPHEVHANGFYEHRHVPYDGGSSRSSPDQLSPPRLRRS